ncbi:putative membrane protein [Sphingomonas sp. SORGH_AS789]|nr:putative membrane protein [Sphingomonas sp. SORGH_AS_0789]MDR6150025.1 putative membrane protein [Sphingomonas sp. SORGH_AS_0742]
MSLIGIMMVIGCLSLIILPLLGFVIGAYYGGVAIGIWAALAGLGLAILACVIPVVALIKARPSR